MKRRSFISLVMGLFMAPFVYKEILAGVESESVVDSGLEVLDLDSCYDTGWITIYPGPEDIVQYFDCMCDISFELDD